VGRGGGWRRSAARRAAQGGRPQRALTDVALELIVADVRGSNVHYHFQNYKRIGRERGFGFGSGNLV
jgi:hypothetical protein